MPGVAPALLVVGALACVLLPLPTALVDLLLSVSLAGGVLLLVASLRVRQTSDFLSFPSLLLLATLFRLALNVSTTRLILSQGDAGRVVDAFANLVVRGDLIVGGVMFLIVTVVQYLVIARGAERVAEVAARFALDALPGGQAAIDADLRAGAISAVEAAERRARLVETSNFYGAMDGAVRFVKGDAVAGLAITGINLAGGLAVGVGRQGMGVGETLELYGRLTVGDGLLAQIPALLVSLAAGVLVSRVDTESEGSERRWLEPAMLVVPAVLLVTLSVIPGMPWLAFATTAVGLVGLAVLLAARVEDAIAPQRGILVAVGPGVGPADPRHLRELGEGLWLRSREALGIEVPTVEVDRDEALPPGRLEVRHEARVLDRRELAGADGDAVALAAFRAIMSGAPGLYDLAALDRDVGEARARHPQTVRIALGRIDQPDLLRLMRCFLRERVPAPPVAALLAVVAEGEEFRDRRRRAEWAELVRLRLADHWVRDLVEGAHSLGETAWIRPTPDLEELWMARSRSGPDGPELAATHRQLEGLRAQVASLAGDAPSLVLTSPALRPVFAAALLDARPHRPVFATTELDAAGLARPEVTWLDLDPDSA